LKMSTEPVTPQIAKSDLSHPLAPLSASEIAAAAAAIKASWPAHTDFHFKVITLQEPPKADALRYLDAEHSHKPRPNIARKAFVNYYIRNTVRLSELLADPVLD
jgi:primary-amine oxidase